jgi:hypothetical protein
VRSSKNLDIYFGLWNSGPSGMIIPTPAKGGNYKDKDIVVLRRGQQYGNIVL